MTFTKKLLAAAVCAAFTAPAVAQEMCEDAPRSADAVSVSVYQSALNASMQRERRYIDTDYTRSMGTAKHVLHLKDSDMTEANLMATCRALDDNNSGGIDKVEALGLRGLADRFDEIDCNGDGVITCDELQRYAGMSVTTRTTVTTYTPEPEPEVTTTTVTTVTPENSKTFVVDGEEVTVVQLTPAQVRGIIHERDTQSIKSRGIEALFDEVDLDDDMKIYYYEAYRLRGLQADFASLDDNGDGHLTLPEFRDLTMEGQ